jgi:hypothetical protein
MAAAGMERELGHISLHNVLFDEKSQRRIVAVGINSLKAAATEFCKTPAPHPGQFYSCNPVPFPAEPDKAAPSLSLSQILATHIPDHQQNAVRDYTTVESLMPLIQGHCDRLLKGPSEYSMPHIYKMVLLFSVLGMLYLSVPLQQHVKRFTPGETAVAYFDTLDGGLVIRMEKALCGTIDDETGKQQRAALLPQEIVASEVALYKMLAE